MTLTIEDIFFFILIAGIAILPIIISFYGLNYTPKELSMPLNISVEINQTMYFNITDAMFIEEATKRFAKHHNYTKNVYNCVNYSNDFKDVMQEFGYDVEVLNGWKEDLSAGHAWNCISIEPQNVKGQFINYRNVYNFSRKLN